MKPNVILALLAGLVVGFVVGKAVTGPSSSSNTAAVVGGGGGGGDESEATLEIKSADMPAGTFANMTDGQKFAVMKVMNDNVCDCGCDKGTLAHCVKEDPNCPNSPAKLKQAVELAKQGKNAQQITAEMFGPGKVKAAARPTANNDQQVFKVDDNGQTVHGNNNALVTIVEYSDYQCPFCGRANATIEQIQNDYGDKIRVVMKQNPLPFHDRAKPAALAALAAGEQGKYKEMHHALFSNQTALDDASLEKYAREVGLNVDRWKSDQKNPKYADVISKQQGEAAALGATGTPTFFINGHKLVGALPPDQFKTAIDTEYAKADALVKSGTPANQVYAKIMATAGSAPAAPAPAGPPAAAAVKKVDVPSDAYVKGPKTAKVTIVMWSDFQCPFCGRVEPTIKQIEDKYGKDVRVVWRNQPLPFHPNAKPAAIAAMAAGDQGKFWEMHDKLFANQTQLSPENYEKWAQELGLNMSKWKADVASGKYDARIAADMSAGAAVGANGTPTFFIDGRQVVGAQPLPSFTSVIDDELQKADKLLKAGVKPDKIYERLMADAAAAPAPAPAAPGAPAPGAVQQVAIGSAPVKGPANAPVTIVMFSDFQCPFCGRVEPTITQIEEQYKGKVKVAWKNQPLPFHQFAKPAAMAAMAANEQGKFWEYHDKLFANQNALDRPSLDKYAQEIGLNMTKFKAAVDSNKFDSQIQADSQEGSRLGANGTPTFFINGRQVIGAQPIDSFKAIIDDELKKKN